MINRRKSLAVFATMAVILTVRVTGASAAAPIFVADPNKAVVGSNSMAGMWAHEQEPSVNGVVLTDRVRPELAPVVPGDKYQPVGNAMRVELQPQDRWNGQQKEKSQIYDRHGGSKPAEQWPDPVGSERWYSITVMVPQDFQFDKDSWMAIANWEGTGGYSPVSLQIAGDHFRLAGNKSRDLGVIQRGHWTNIVIGVKHANDASGWVEVYRDNNVVVPRTDGATMATYQGKPVPEFLTFGMARSLTWTTTNVLWFGAFKIGTQKDDVLSAGSVPATSTTVPRTTTTTMRPPTGPTPTSTTPTNGYRLLSVDGHVSSYGKVDLGNPTGSVQGKAVAMSSTPSGNGYWVASSSGQVFPFGDASDFGSMAGQHLNGSIISMTATPSGNGYWLLGSDGGVFAYGDAGFYGSTGSIHLNKPAVGITASASGHGYWFVASDGGVFAYGDAAFAGSMGSSRLNQPVVGLTVSTTGHGYRMVAADGGIFSFGDAGFYGSLGSNPPAAPVQAMAPTRDGRGYYMVTTGGKVFPFGSAVDLGGALDNTVAITL